MITTMETPGLLERILGRTEVAAATGCRVWLGRTDRGYGRTTVNDKEARVHRVIYELTVGPIPDGLQIDHLCRNRACVNVDHLEVVTLQENLARKPLPDRCSRGHEFTPENTRYIASKKGRVCIACRRDNGRRHDAKRRPRAAERRGVRSA